MEFYQKQISLPPMSRGFHLITQNVIEGVEEIRNIEIGICQVFIRHTSASLCINENADKSVREDMLKYLNKYVPENEPYYRHTAEGSDDMPAHIKTVLMGTSVEIPISNGKLALGTWQGIYLGEHRNNGGSRKIIISAWGK